MSVLDDAITTRLRAIVAAYPDASMGTDVTEGDPILDLPAYEVYERGASRQALDAIGRLVTTVYVVRVYHTEVKDITDERQIRAAYKLARVLVNPLADYLAAHPALAFGDNGLPCDTGEVRNTGVSLADYNRKPYASFDLELPITTASIGS